MLAVYRLLIVLIAPLALVWLRWKIAGPAELRARWRERLGSVPRLDSQQPVLWLHAASVGEVNAVAALVTAMLERYPDHRLVISTMTVTGRAEAIRRFGDRVDTVFAPLDTPWAVSRWLKRIRPRLAMVAETEIWPELYRGCSKRAIPLVLVNARLAPSAMKRYRRFHSLFAGALSSVDLAICQSEDDARRFGELGLDEDRIAVAGNLKFDRVIPDDLGETVRKLRSEWGERPTWVAGSTRPGEEAIVLDAHARLRERRPEALLILAPRHPERSDEIRTLIEKAGLKHQPIGQLIELETAVVLVDRIGILLSCYAAAPAAFVGGSLVDIGGHNLLEPAAFGKAVIAGAHLHQQADSAEALRDNGALIEVQDADGLARAVLSIWEDPQRALEYGRAALEVVENGRGSVRRTLKLLDGIL
ncbi:3-deoxy-D-manno-octulosonic acid transferase [Wenzhouxiangella sp. 15190]|uniref:3-deoxy-D-manno-octulosonic acid transferase n=1 Tax=Wenzhouxiangella sp. 15190 TaxID=2301225 RepID=UPI000E32667F|nr:3-deoxy-D-manno-octulosonic acid transferase [Wenzhouxiangella sp. 15190]RFF28540.1 3-deoxy-D-manno-octulosonic acid transferase [Wenzhouxiangella sp. 15181]RFP70059.1 3-deoxy-D-manno-octulosonic acid transferase [Wenzhouxiangella sp. 15190]